MRYIRISDCEENFTIEVLIVKAFSQSVRSRAVFALKNFAQIWFDPEEKVLGRLKGEGKFLQTLKLQSHISDCRHSEPLRHKTFGQKPKSDIHFFQERL